MMKDLHTHVEVLLKQKKDRKRELKALREQDKNLCDILCVSNFSIDDSAVPSLDELDRYRRHVASLSAEKVSRRGPDFWGGGGLEGAHWVFMGLLTSRSEGKKNLSASSGRSSSAWRSWSTALTPASSGTWCVRTRRPSACPQITLLTSRAYCSRYVGTLSWHSCD